MCVLIKDIGRRFRFTVELQCNLYQGQQVGVNPCKKPGIPGTVDGPFYGTIARASGAGEGSLIYRRRLSDLIHVKPGIPGTVDGPFYGTIAQASGQRGPLCTDAAYQI